MQNELDGPLRTCAAGDTFDQVTHRASAKFDFVETRATNQATDAECLGAWRPFTADGLEDISCRGQQSRQIAEGRGTVHNR